MITALALIAVQLVVAGVFGFKPPAFNTGYYEAPQETAPAPTRSVLSEARRQELEALLAPPPVLAFSDQSSTLQLPADLTNSAVLLSFADQPAARAEDDLNEADPADGADPADPADAAEDRTELALTVPPKEAIVVPEESLDALPDLPAIDGAFGAVLEIDPVYLAKLPPLDKLSVDQRKKRFVAIMLPLILKANAELEDRRSKIGKDADEGNIVRLRRWAELYRYVPENDDVETIRTALLERVNTVPVSLALAQAAIESGWGTSRFSIQGNALYGQWAWSRDKGIRPSESRHENAVVRSFATLFDSVRAYMHNLNTHRSYQDFRETRAKPNAAMADMVKTLTSYSEEGEVYVAKLFSLINNNSFRLYENAVLAEK